eukprot:5153278-Alexandrium_andersonii.AAC.1
MSASLVGSEMCIRDRCARIFPTDQGNAYVGPSRLLAPCWMARSRRSERCCLLYTSDAADDM